jgi:hypothetical protein
MKAEGSNKSPLKRGDREGCFLLVLTASNRIPIGTLFGLEAPGGNRMGGEGKRSQPRLAERCPPGITVIPNETDRREVEMRNLVTRLPGVIICENLVSVSR